MLCTMAIVESEATRHRALADPRRTRIVEELRGGALDAHDLARRLGLHVNTVRFHLALLRDAGLVASCPADRSTPGRPRIVYSLSREAAHDTGGEHRLLAAMLAGAVAGAEDGPQRAEQAGRAWGRYLVKRPLPLVTTSDEDARAEIEALLEEQGFEPERVAGDICMHRCPFHELAETHPQVVCAVHRGLISGALEELRSDLQLTELEVFPCVARLAASSRSRSSSR